MSRSQLYKEQQNDPEILFLLERAFHEEEKYQKKVREKSRGRHDHKPQTNSKSVSMPKMAISLRIKF